LFLEDKMPFSENQLAIWSNQGAVTTSALTYNSVKTCIDGINWNSDILYDVYLQGSYRNSTNIRGNSDVDVVVEFQSSFYSNKNSLPSDQLREHNEYYGEAAKYTLSDFRMGLVEGLKNYYGQNIVNEGNRAIKITGASGRLSADLVCCAQYKEYRSFSINFPDNYAGGIIFWERNTNREVINFPKLHYDNGVTKNQNTNNNYKPVVRIFKNIVSRLVESGKLNASSAPSYFIECLLFNIVNNNFQQNSYFAIVLSILNALHDVTDNQLMNFLCQNQMRNLFGKSDQQWNIPNCRQFISRTIGYWNEE
jgi:hypothetical protein